MGDRSFTSFFNATFDSDYVGGLVWGDKAWGHDFSSQYDDSALGSSHVRAVLSVFVEPVSIRRA